MDTNPITPGEDAEMAECDGEKVVTMMDVLEEQENFEKDANAVLGASDEKNCTYSKGYINRQAIYACLTCCSEAKSDPAKRAGVCLACSLTCHENHELIELYTKRNFRCDCGNPKFNSHPCQYTPNKTDLNENNCYNQNFSGLYCICNRPYPDPDVTEEDEMIQCIICEDWLHESHLEAMLPPNDQYAEMICKSCMKKNEFLHDYSNLAVNVETDIEDIDGNSSDTIKINGDVPTPSEKPIDNDPKGEKVDIKVPDKLPTSSNNETENNEFVQLSLVPNSTDNNPSNLEETDVTKLNAENGITKIPESTTTEDSHSTLESNTNAHSENMAEERLLADLKDDKKDELSEPKCALGNSEMNTDATTQSNKETIENNVSDINTDVKKSVESEENTNPDKIGESEANPTSEEAEDVPNLSKSDDIEQNAKYENKENSVLPFSDLDSEGNSNQLEPQNINSNDEIVKTANNEVETNLMDTSSEQNADLNSATAERLDLIETNTPTNVEGNSGQVQSETNVEHVSEELCTIDKDDVLLDTGVNLDKEYEEKKEQPVADKENDMEPGTNQTKIEQSTCNEEIEDKGLENKRKHSLDDDGHMAKDADSSSKRLKLDSCTRPRDVKRIYKGATFWPSDFRQKLCTCTECLTMYKDLSVLYLIDLDDTVSAYENLGEEKGRIEGRPTSQYEKGLQALSSLDRTQQINALTEYNKMKDKLLEFLKNFKDRKEVVKEEDIKEFFAGMKPKREPDGVYFCR